MIDRRDRKSPSTVIVTTTDRPNRLPHQPGFLISAEKTSSPSPSPSSLRSRVVARLHQLAVHVGVISIGRLRRCGVLGEARTLWHLIFIIHFFWHEENIACKGVSSEGAAEAYCIACTGRQTGLALVQVE
jgi:hypothetical protein